MNQSSTKKTDKVVHSYHDHANDAEEESTLQGHLTELSLYRPADQNFVARLHRLLSCAEQDGSSHIISWQPHGRSFLVHDKKLFEQQVMPKWFQQSSMSSFLRQLNLYGFMRLHKGADKGGYYHELFLRGKPTLCRRIERTRIKGRGARKAVSHESEPDFYAMAPLPSVDSSNAGQPSPLSATQPTTVSGAPVAPVRNLPALEPRGPTLGDLAAQQESQQAALLQQLGLWQGGNDQGISPMPALSSPATLPYVSTSLAIPPAPAATTSSTATHSNSGPQQLPVGTQTVDNSSLFRSATGLPQSASSFAVVQRDFLSGGLETIAGDQQWNQAENVASAPAGHYAALPTAQALAATMGQDLSSQLPPSSQLAPAPQQQASVDASSASSLRSAAVPGFLASLYEPTPFPQLPNQPPSQLQGIQEGQPTQSDRTSFGGDLMTYVAASQLAAPRNQILQARIPNSGDLSHHLRTGIHPSLAPSSRIFPSRPTEEGKEASRPHQPESQQKDDQGAEKNKAQ